MKALVGLFVVLVGSQASAVDYICSTVDKADGSSAIYLTSTDAGYDVSVFYPYDKPEDKGVCYQDDADLRDESMYTCAMKDSTLEVKFEKYEYDHSYGSIGVATLNRYTPDGALASSTRFECEETPGPCEGKPAKPAFTAR